VDSFERAKPRARSKDGLSDSVRTLGDRLALRSAMAGPTPEPGPGGAAPTTDPRWTASLLASAEVHGLVDRLVAAGRFGEARRALTTYAASRIAQEAVHPRQGIATDHSSQYVSFRVTDDPTRSTFGAQAQIRVAQVDLSAEASRLVGRRLDLSKLSDARVYFQALAQRGDPQAVRDAYATYLSAFYTHSGSGADWTRHLSPSQRVASLEQITADLPRDVARRQLIDCEGFGMLTERLLGDLRDRTGQPMFSVQHAVDAQRTHVMATVVDRQGNGFIVDNADVSPTLGPAHHARRLEAMRTRRENPFWFGLSIDAAHGQD
jgi:hypothetical protein